MGRCSGADMAWSAAEPNWLDQASEQLSALYNTLDEINDPTASECYDALEGRIDELRSQAIREQSEDF